MISGHCPLERDQVNLSNPPVQIYPERPWAELSLPHISNSQSCTDFGIFKVNSRVLRDMTRVHDAIRCRIWSPSPRKKLHDSGQYPGWSSSLQYPSQAPYLGKALPHPTITIRSPLPNWHADTYGPFITAANSSVLLVIISIPSSPASSALTHCSIHPIYLSLFLSRWFPCVGRQAEPSQNDSWTSHSLPPPSKFSAERVSGHFAQCVPVFAGRFLDLFPPPALSRSTGTTITTSRQMLYFRLKRFCQRRHASQLGFTNSLKSATTEPIAMLWREENRREESGRRGEELARRRDGENEGIEERRKRVRRREEKRKEKKRKEKKD
jgi:hypothetical protein